MGIFSWLFGKKPEQPQTVTDTVTLTYPGSAPEKQKPAPKPKPETVEKNFRISKDSIQIEAIMRLAKENPDWKLTKSQMLKSGIDQVNRYLFDIQTTEIVTEEATENSPASVKIMMDGEYIGKLRDGNNAQIFNLIRRGQILKITGHIKGGPFKFLDDINYDGDGIPSRPSDFELSEDESSFSAQISILKKN